MLFFVESVLFAVHLDGYADAKENAKNAKIRKERKERKEARDQ
jgi:hypothetical protein